MIDNLRGQEIICQEITLCYGNNPEISEASNNKCLFLPHGKYPSGVSWESTAAQQPHLKTFLQQLLQVTWWTAHWLFKLSVSHTSLMKASHMAMHNFKEYRKVQYYHIPREM